MYIFNNQSMEDEMKSSRMINHLIVSAFALLIVFAACSSPAVTGMKVHIQNGEYEDTIHLADSVIAEGDSLNAAIWFYRGQAQYNLSDWEGASESLMKVHSLDVKSQFDILSYWGALYNAAAFRLNDGDIDGAKYLLETGKELMHAVPNFDLLLGEIALGIEEDVDVALICFNSAWALDEIQIASLEASIADTDEPAELYYLEGDLDRAVTIGIQALFNTGVINTMKAVECDVEEEKTQFYQDAKDAFSTGLLLDPTSIDILKSLAEVYMMEGDYESAITVYDETLLNIETGVNEGWIPIEDAVMISANILVSKGFALIEMNRYGDGINELNQAREMAGNDYMVLATLAHAWFTMEEYDEALLVLDETIILDGLTPGEYANAYYMIFACNTRIEEDEAAADALETALEYDPENGEYWGLLASTYSRLGRRNAAIEAMEKAELYGN